MYRQGRTAIVLTLVAFALSWLVLTIGTRVGVQGGDKPAFHIDEAHKLSEAYYYDLFFERGELDHPDWSGDFYARTNPPVAKYLFGAALAAAGEHVRDKTLLHEFELKWEKPSELRKAVPDAQLRVTRRLSVIYGALICAALFFVAYRAAGLAAGVVTVVLLLAHTNFHQTVQRGLTDSILLFHLALIGPVSILATDALTTWWNSATSRWSARRVLTLVVFAILLPAATIALAAGSKLNGVLTAPVYAIVLVVSAIRAKDARTPLVRRMSAVVLMLGSTAAVSAALFVSLNPYFYSAPIDRASQTMRAFGDWMICQQINPGDGLFTPSERAAAVSAASFETLTAPLVPWLRRLGSYAAGFAAMAGLCYLVLNRRDVGKRATLERAAPDGAASARDVALVWSAVCLAAVTAWVPVAWDRYLLPTVLAVSLLMGIGASIVPGAVRSLLELCRARRAWPQALRLCAGAAVVLLGTVVLVGATSSASYAFERTGRMRVSSLSTWWDSPRMRKELALRELRAGHAPEALEELEHALEMVGPDPGDRSPAAVERCCLLYLAAQQHLDAGRKAAAIAALEEHVELLRRFWNRMASNDPYVRGVFGSFIDGRARDLAQLRAEN